MMLQSDAMVLWYPFIIKSPLTPPGIVFVIVWSVLYLLMGISAGLVWKADKLYSWVLVLLFIVQLVLNLMWSFCFFYMQSPLLGFAVLAVLFLFVLLYVIGCYGQNKWASIINIPYLLWLLFAGYLNLYVVVNG